MNYFTNEVKYAPGSGSKLFLVAMIWHRRPTTSPDTLEVDLRTYFGYHDGFHEALGAAITATQLSYDKNHPACVVTLFMNSVTLLEGVPDVRT